MWIVDRRKDMILTAGYNVYPAELERVIAMHPGGCARRRRPAAGRDEGRDREGVRGAQAGRNDRTRRASSRTAARTSLPTRCHAQVQFVDDVPKTSTGKIMRRELKTLDA